LWQEIAYLSYHMHWSLRSVLDLEHADRIRLVKEVAALNQRAMEQIGGVLG
jgi:hypothetical protein